jgi:O-antigen/teichoic acid export membrane protein
VTRLSLPRLSALQREPAALRDAYGDLAQLQALMGMPLATGIALTAPDLVMGLLGPAWAEAGGAARITGLAALVTFSFGDVGSLFVAVGKTRINLCVSLVQLFAPLLLLFVVRPSTPLGIAACWAAVSLTVAPFVARLALREIGRPPLWLFARIAPAAGATAAMAAAVLTLQRAVEGPPLLRLLLSAALGAAVFGLVAWLALGRRIPRALRHHAVAPAE